MMENKLARLISFLLHPILLGVLFLIYLFLFKEHLNIYQAGLIIILDLVIPIGLIFYLLKKKIVQNFDISDRKKRKYLYFPIAILLLVTLPLFWVFRFPRVLVLMQISGLIWISCWAVTSLFYKISGHVGGAGFVYAAIIFLFGQSFWPLFLLLPPLAWSRVKLKEHTWDQTIVGGILGVVISFIVFNILNKI